MNDRPVWTPAYVSGWWKTYRLSGPPYAHFLVREPTGRRLIPVRGTNALCGTYVVDFGQFEDPLTGLEGVPPCPECALRVRVVRGFDGPALHEVGE